MLRLVSVAGFGTLSAEKQNRSGATNYATCGHSASHQTTDTCHCIPSSYIRTLTSQPHEHSTWIDATALRALRERCCRHIAAAFVFSLLVSRCDVVSTHSAGLAHQSR